MFVMHKHIFEVSEVDAIDTVRAIVLGSGLVASDIHSDVSFAPWDT